MRTQILNGKVLTPNGWIENGSVLIKDSIILDVLNHSNRLSTADKIIDAEGGAWSVA